LREPYSFFHHGVECDRLKEPLRLLADTEDEAFANTLVPFPVMITAQRRSYMVPLGSVGS